MRDRYSDDEYFNPDGLSHADLTHDIVAKSDAMVEQIKPILAGNPPLVVNTVLAELLAVFVTGHAPPLREPLLTTHLDYVRAFMPLVEAQMRKQGMWPEEWDEPT